MPVRCPPHDRRRHVDAALLEFPPDQLSVRIVTERPEVASRHAQPHARRERRRHLTARTHLMAIDADLGDLASGLRIPRKAIDVIDGVLAEADNYL